jgi:hypothetical protein
MGEDNNSAESGKGSDNRYKTDIDLEDGDEVEEWCRSFACTPAELQAAVKEMGHSAKRVRVYLRDKQQSATHSPRS